LSFELLFEQNSFLEESIARAIKIFLSELGINVQPRPLPMPEKEKALASNEFTAVINSYAYFDDYMFYALRDFYEQGLKGKEPAVNYQNPTLERLFNQVEVNPDQWQQLARRYQIALHQDAPVVFLYFDDKIIYAVNNRFQNVRVPFSNGTSYYFRLNPLENWFVPKSMQKFQTW
ncbi:MAG: hypothetical protein WAN36_00190, partial [Calditrichia bacterium]